GYDGEIYTVKRNNPPPNWKTSYRLKINGNLAIQWMMTLYCLMGVRRKLKIREHINKWKSSDIEYQIENNKVIGVSGRKSGVFYESDEFNKSVKYLLASG